MALRMSRNAHFSNQSEFNPNLRARLCRDVDCRRGVCRRSNRRSRRAAAQPRRALNATTSRTHSISRTDAPHGLQDHHQKRHLSAQRTASKRPNSWACRAFCARWRAPRSTHRCSTARGSHVLSSGRPGSRAASSAQSERSWAPTWGLASSCPSDAVLLSAAAHG